MEATTEGSGTKETLENLGNDSLAAVGEKNELLFDELFSIIIQKECELVCLRSEIEMHKNTGCIKPASDQSPSSDEEARNAIQQIQGFGDINTESHEPHTTFSKIKSFFKKNSLPSITKETQEALDQSMQESQLQEIYEALKKMFCETKTNFQTHIREERLEIKTQKDGLHEKELQLQKERSEIENLRYQLEDEKNKLGNDKRKIEIELRNLLADNSEWDLKEEEHSENCGEYDIKEGSQVSHSERKVDYNQLLIDGIETGTFQEKTNSDTIGTDYAMDELSTFGGNGENVKEMDINIKPSEKLDHELQQLAEAKVDEIILVQEEKLTELQYFTDTWKQTVEDERKLMNYGMENREKVSHQIRESCQMAIENISKEWIEIKEAYNKIQVHQSKLQELENKIATTKIELDKKKILYKEGLTKIENDMHITEAEWKNINFEKDKIKTERALLEMDKENLQKSREAVERQKQELEKSRLLFMEEVRVGEEIQKRVDEKRTTGIIEEQRNLEEKREMLMIEHHDLYKARQICDAHRAILEWERMCIAREKEEVQDQWIQLEKEKMALGIIKATNDEKMMMIESTQKKIEDKESEIDNQFKQLEEERKCISDERITLQSEKYHLNELKTTVLRRVSEINTEINQVEQQKKELLSLTSVIDRKKSELDAEWEALKQEKKECMEMTERTGPLEAWQNYKLKHSEMVRCIKNRILSLVEDVSCMEEVTLDEPTQCSQYNFHQQYIFDNKQKSEQGINAQTSDENHLTQRIKHLVKSVKSMEKDMHKMKSKINRRQQLKKKVTKLKNQVKKMQGQISNLQKKLKEKSEINFNAIDLMNRLMHPYEESLMTKLDNRKCDACETITSIKNIMTTAGNMAGDWKSTCFLKKKYCHKCLKSIHIMEKQNVDPKNGGSHDCWKGGMKHGKKSPRDLNNRWLKVEDETFFEETPYSHINCWMKAKDKKKDFVNVDKEFQKHEQLAVVRESENDIKSHFFSSINTSWRMRPESDSSMRDGKQRSVWNLAFILAIILSYGATSVYKSSS